MHLILPLLVLLGLPQLPGLPHIPGLPKSWSDIKKHLPKHVAPLDSLPPAWKPASRLALEDQFVKSSLTVPSLVRGPIAFRVSDDPRRVRIRLDPDSGSVTYATELGTIELGEAARVPLVQFSHDLGRSTFERLWLERSRQSIQGSGAPIQPTNPAARGLAFELPSPLPKRVQSLLGPGGPSLNVYGSENIRLSGQSQWSNQQVGQLGLKRSLFPSLDMQQDLDIRLEGRLSDRTAVNLLQNSANQIPLENRIAINYKGDEDDLVQSLDLGNTNLSLPGTQYVSYSGKNEGLFGMKATTRLGPLDVTMLASKQEGRSERSSYQGGSSRQDQTLLDKDYVKGVYFFLYDPNQDVQDIDEGSIRLYLDEGTFVNQINTVRGRAFVDPNQACTDPLACGDANNDGKPDTTRSLRGTFRLLELGGDPGKYQILSDIYGPFFKVIRLRTALSSDKQKLAVTYRYHRVVNGVPEDSIIVVGGQLPADTLIDVDGVGAVTMKLLRAPFEELTGDANGNFDPTAPFAPVRELELRNFYQLAGQLIDAKTFQIAIRKGDDSPPRTTVRPGVPYIQVLGLDNFDETSGFVDFTRHGHDDRVDGTAPSSTFRAFVDFQNGTLFLPDPRPFAPRLGSDASGGKRFDREISRLLFRSDSLVGGPGEANEANPAIYDKRTVLSTDREYSIDLRFTAQRAGNEVTLGRTNIIEGSDVVTINGQPLARDRDYRIDYDLGKVTLIRQLGGADQLNIDYSYAPLFQQAGRTLLGNSFRYEGRDRSFGGAFLYESRGAQDLRPRIGEEPSQVVIGDLNSEWHFRPDWVTRWVDDLPGVRTTAPSEFNLSAEMGASFPNPNTRNEVFIDDMEGVRDAVSLSMGPERWRWTSDPQRSQSQTVEDPGSEARLNAEIHWFSPLNVVHERDLKPTLTNAQGAQNTRQVLALSLPRRPTAVTDPNQRLWAGLTYPIDPAGIDLSRAQFIDLWVNDFRDFHYGVQVDRVRGPHVKLRIDLGVVAEDQRRAPNVPPNGKLDTEDVTRDNQLTVTDAKNEDTGFDNQLDAAEQPAVQPDLTTVGPGDPEGDDFQLPNKDFNDLDPRKWQYTNGTEGNKNVLPIPDTEDLNLDNSRDTGQNYFEYTIDLGDEDGRYLATDVHRTFSTYTNDGDVVPVDNGWRRFRIPISDSLRVQFGSPDLSRVQHVRVWVDSVLVTDPPPLSDKDGRPFLMLGGLEIVGSRWFTTALDTTQRAAGTTITLNSVNTVDNADIYAPPFDPGRTRSGSQELTRREQALALEFTDLAPDDTLEIYKTFSLDEDYSRYGKLDWFAAAFQIDGYNSGADTLDYFVRFASDEKGNNYYEVRRRMPPSSTRPPSGQSPQITWQEAALTLTDISNLKLNADFPKSGDILYQVPGKNPDEVYIIRGRPSFTRLRRISFGVRNASGKQFPTGQLWLDELRATDVAKDAGRAQRINVNGRMSNLLTYNLAWSGRDANFQSVGESRGSGNSTDGLNFNTGLDLHRFIEGTGIVLPVNFSYVTSHSSPRFTAGDDVVRTGAVAQASESKTTSKVLSTSYSRGWSDRSNPFLRYTLGGISANFNHNWLNSRGPTSVDSSRALDARVLYGISPRRLLAVPMPLKTRLYPLPERFWWNYQITTSVARSYDRQRDSSGALVLRNQTRGRTGFIDFGADTRPFDFFHHQFSALRNLTLPPALREEIGFVNLGRVVHWQQSMDSRVALQKYGPWLKPNLSWNSSYAQDNGTQLSKDLSVRAIKNQQQINITWDLPFDRMVRPTVRPDSTRGQDGAWRAWIARLGQVSTDFSFSTNSNHSRLTGTPSFLYLVGVSRDPGLKADSSGRVRPQFGNRSDNGEDWHGGARSVVRLGLGATVSTRGNFGANRSVYNGVIKRGRTSRFPELDVEYGRIAEAVGLKKLLVNPQLRTAYSRSQTTDFANSSSPTLVSTVGEWRPMLGLSGELKNGTRTELRVERRVTQSENRQLGRSLTTDRNTDVNFSLSRAYSKGQKINVLGKETLVHSSINLGMTGVYSRRTGETLREGSDQPQYQQGSDRLSVNAQGSYGFSSNVTGNLELGFSQSRDLQNQSVNRSLRIELRAQFTF